MTVVEKHETFGRPATRLFARIVVGIDGTEPGFEACRQAARLVDPNGSLELFSAVHLAETALAGYSAPRLADDLLTEGQQALDRATGIGGYRATARLVNGPPTESLLKHLQETQASMVALGTHGHSRASEIILGGVAGELLHLAPCSVLIARPPVAEALFPRSIVVGIDGSEASDRALAAAHELAGRFNVSLRIVTALGGKGIDMARTHLRSPFCEAIDGHPVEVLVSAARDADLLVVGNHGLHGLRALGSVSERVAHRARSSVLVVRG